ncbi:MAG: hypothetical protein JXA15_02690 [Spirochaetales bacterium]|nr:hypothetical protein [Spirochaetales bacterium]
MHRRAAAAILLMIATGLAPSFALEVEGSAHFGNIAFPWDQDAPSTEPFPGDSWSWGASLGFEEYLSEGFRVLADYDTDPVLRHVVSAAMVYEAGFASIGLGPFLGALGSAETPLKAGIYTTVSVGWPGLAFAGLEAAASVGAGLVSTGDLLLESSRLYAGWYARNAICTVSVQSKRFDLMRSDTVREQDAFNQYAFEFEIFDKTAPYRIMTRLAYATLSKTWDDEATSPSTDTLGTLSFGTTLTLRVSPTLDLLGGFDAAVYAFGLDGMAARGPAATTMLFDASLGFRYRLEDRRTEAAIEASGGEDPVP